MYSRRLEKDQIVLTGSPLPLWRVTVGDRLEVASEFGKLVTAVIQ
jgi:hypothetical protein